jgi:diguanylate cyclase (GGDEF)-like protein
MAKYRKWLEQPPTPLPLGQSWRWIVIVVLAVAIVGLGDLASGGEISFSLFYAVPIMVGVWRLGRPAAIALPIAAAVTWLVADQLDGTDYGATWIGFWNSAIRLGFFLVIGLLVNEVRSLLVVQQGLARTDGLTGVFNGRTFVSEVEREIVRSRRHQLPTCLVYIDLDDFKGINDRLGHNAGDEVLRRLADALQSSTRATDIIGRMGGDEFAVLLPVTGQEGGISVAEKLRATAAADPDLTISVGLVSCATAPPTAEDLIRAADAAMYAAKRLGKNRVEHRHLEFEDENSKPH